MTADRRTFLKGSAAAVGAAAAGRARADGRPNILLALDDQERQPLHLPPLNLPNRDRLRGHAVEFTHAFCVYPLCSPSRAATFTGLWPHQAGMLTNVDPAAKNPPLPTEVPNLARALQGCGYHTAYFGKWHLSYKWDRVNPLRAYGFEASRLGNQLLALGSDPGVSASAAAWLRTAGRRPPWFMVYAPINPHDICFPFLDQAYPVKKDYGVSLPPNFSPTPAPDIATLRAHREIGWVERLLPRTAEKWLAYLNYYCYLIEEVDLNLGRVLDALEASGQWDHTVVIYTSDHGEMGGSHGLAHKAPTMYEENIRIPLWIADPRRTDGFGRRDALVSNLDITPTICALAGASFPASLPGNDLAPALGGRGLAGAEAVFCEGSPRPTAVWRGMRTREWKYWHYANGEELLFNIADDPWELRNLAKDPGSPAMLISMRERVREWRRATDDPIREFL